jgi:hypothetical protein
MTADTTLPEPNEAGPPATDAAAAPASPAACAECEQLRAQLATAHDNYQLLLREMIEQFDVFNGTVIRVADEPSTLETALTGLDIAYKRFLCTFNKSAS